MNNKSEDTQVEEHTPDEIKQIEEKTLELMREIDKIKQTLSKIEKLPKSNPEEQTERDINILSLVDYIDELLKAATDKIINEIRGEFYRLFNSLSGLGGVVTPIKQMKDFDLEKTAIGERKEGMREKEELSKSVQNDLAKLDLYKYLLNERETLIYELTDRLVAVETENKKLKEKLKKLEKEKERWEKQREFLSELMTTDPRYKILTLLKQTKIIAPVQLSFVLGVSLGQVREYLKQLAKMKIITFNDDGSVQLNTDFDVEVVTLWQGKKKTNVTN